MLTERLVPFIHLRTLSIHLCFHKYDIIPINGTFVCIFLVESSVLFWNYIYAKSGHIYDHTHGSLLLCHIINAHQQTIVGSYIFDKNQAIKTNNMLQYILSISSISIHVTGYHQVTNSGFGCCVTFVFQVSIMFVSLMYVYSHYINGLSYNV